MANLRATAKTEKAARASVIESDAMVAAPELESKWFEIFFIVDQYAMSRAKVHSMYGAND